jgi:hypothetical protein
MSALGRFIFWDYPRGGWQYDLMVAIILAFIFLTPREVFRDQPKPASIYMLPSEESGGAYFVETRLLDGVAPADLAARATALVNARFKTHQTVIRVEPIRDSEDDIIGYTAYTRP